MSGDAIDIDDFLIETRPDRRAHARVAQIAAASAARGVDDEGEPEPIRGDAAESAVRRDVDARRAKRAEELEYRRRQLRHRRWIRAVALQLRHVRSARAHSPARCAPTRSMRAAFADTLPVAGRDGTLSRRLAGTAAEGRVRAKTGTVDNVRAIAGYVETADGETLRLFDHREQLHRADERDRCGRRQGACPARDVFKAALKACPRCRPCSHPTWSPGTPAPLRASSQPIGHNFRRAADCVLDCARRVGDAALPVGRGSSFPPRATVLYPLAVGLTRSQPGPSCSRHPPRR